jgi:hypothetical protein
LAEIGRVGITSGPYRVTSPPGLPHNDLLGVVRQLAELDRGKDYLVIPSECRFDIVDCPTMTDLDPLWPDEMYP